MNSKSLPAAVLLSGVVGTLPAVFADAAEAAPQQNQQITRRIKVSANTANLEEYRKLAEFAKDLGATHLGADQIEPSMWQWNADRKDPYPNWSLQRPTLFKYIVPKELEKYLPADYAKRNLDTLAARVKILKEFGLKATFNGMEPPICRNRRTANTRNGAAPAATRPAVPAKHTTRHVSTIRKCAGFTSTPLQSFAKQLHSRPSN